MALSEDIGALWEKKGKGGAYFSGIVKLPDGRKLEIVVFKNGFKKKDNHPDWRIYPSSKQRDTLPQSPREREQQDDVDPFENDR